jgi:hypothetical protein
MDAAAGAASAPGAPPPPPPAPRGYLASAWAAVSSLVWRAAPAAGAADGAGAGASTASAAATSGDPPEYAAALEASDDVEFADMEGLGFLATGFRDSKGRPAALIIAKRYPAGVVPPDRLFRCVLWPSDCPPAAIAAPA